MIGHKEIPKEDIAHRAYEIYVQRGEQPGKDVEDWITAEKELGVEPIIAQVRAMAAQAGHN